jgi:hypothetical protein
VERESLTMTQPTSQSAAAAPRKRNVKQKRPVKVWFPPTALTVLTWIAILLTLVLPLSQSTLEVPPTEYLLWPDSLGLATLLLVPLFIPLGFFEGWTGASLWRPSKGILVIVLLDATFLSGVAELLQWVLVGPDAIFNRDSSILDMLACVTGGLIGGTIGLTIGPRINRAVWGEIDKPSTDAAPPV